MGLGGLAVARQTQKSRPTVKVERLAWAVVGGVALVALAEMILVSSVAIRQPGGTMVGRDFGLYFEATQRWLHGGSFYLAEHVAGPYVAEWGQILYPPWALLLLVPGMILWPLWFAIPPVVTAWIVWGHRPKLWAWLVIVGIGAWFPGVVLPYWAGTPTTWIVLFVALSARWPWVSALVLLKPSVFPFALLGIRHHAWWLAAAAIGAIALQLPGLLAEWFSVVLNARGPNSGLLYSLGDVPLMLIPVVAWLGRSRTPRRRSRR